PCPDTTNSLVFFFQAEDGIRDFHVTGVQTCALPIWVRENRSASGFGMRWGVRVRVAPCAGAARRDTAMCRSMTGHRRPTCGLAWTTVPVRRTLISGGRAMTDAPRVRVPLGARLRGTFADPVLRSLTIATLISTVGRGVALTLVVLYLSLIARLPAEQVALVFAVGSGIGVAASYLDRK